MGLFHCQLFARCEDCASHAIFNDPVLAEEAIRELLRSSPDLDPKYHRHPKKL